MENNTLTFNKNNCGIVFPNGEVKLIKDIEHLLPNDFFDFIKSVYDRGYNAGFLKGFLKGHNDNTSVI